MDTTIKYTHTPEGRQVLELLESILATTGMEVYKCEACEELFGSHAQDVNEASPECGSCEMDRKALMKAEYPNEHEYDPELDD